MGAVWRGTWHGGLGFTEKCCAPIAIPIGTHGLHAVGAAMAAQRLGEDSVTVAFLGDGATSEGDVHEALNLAAVFKAPCVFYVQNNQWAISVPVSRQMAAPSIAHRAHRLRNAGHPGGRQRRAGLLRGDGRGRQAGPRGRRPDADRGGHLSAGAAHHLRRPHPVPVRRTSWTGGAPATRYRATAPTCRPTGCGRSGSSSGSRRESKRLRTELRDAVVGAPDIDVTEMFDTVYADITPNLAAQREQLLAELAKEA